MTFKRLWHTCRLYFIRGAQGRANYIRKKGLYHYVGNNCSIQSRKIPLYSQLISIHDNVHLASGVSFVSHDIIHRVINGDPSLDAKIGEYIGCIEIMDNVFVGAGTRILYNVRIGANCVIGAGSIVTKDLAPGGVYAGAPAKYICSYEDFVNKRIKMDEELKKAVGDNQHFNQKLPSEVVEKLWAGFAESRS